MSHAGGDAVAVLETYLRSALGAAAAVRIAVDGQVGRHLVATRDLAPGEVIASERHVVAAPQAEALCLRCQRRPSGPAGCGRCGWPLCDSCAREEPDAPSLHVECALLAPLRAQQPWRTWRAPGAVLGLLRCLLLRRTQPDLWPVVDCLQDNMVSLSRTRWLAGCLQNVVDPVQTDCAQDVGVKTLVHLAGVLDTNCFAVSATEELGARALYPLLCLMAHDCSPNSCRFFDAGVVTLVATRPISAGDRVTTSYTSSLWGTDARRAHLADTKFFHCACRRCEDPSEFGTDVTALVCRGGVDDPAGKCCGRRTCRRIGGDVVWQCTQCDRTTSAAQVRSLHQMLAMTLGKTLALRDVAKAERWAEAHREVLSENHYFLLEVQLLLVDLYASGEQRDVAENQKKRKQLCESLLEVTTKLDPGPTRLRGKLLCHLADSCALLADGQHQKSNGPVTKMAEEAAEILQYDGLLRPMAERVLRLAQALGSPA